MQYGYFDDINKEYIINRPDTPKPWSNYLGNTEYGAIITNNAGGYSFYKQGGMGRFLRMRFNSVPLDQPGRYVYLYDRRSRDYWSTTWQPVGKPLDQFQSTCRHGTAYTRISSQYDHIATETTYYVPLGQNYEVWKLEITNLDTKTRYLRGFTFLEYAGNWNAIDDLLNIQYVQYTAKVDLEDGIIDHGTNVHIPAMPEHFQEKDQGRHTFQALVGARITGYDCDREAFLGNVYRSYSNPKVVEQGNATNSKGYGDNPCGSIQFNLVLHSGKSKIILVIAGVGRASKEGRKIVDCYKNNPGKTDKDLRTLKDHWHNRIRGFKATTPNGCLNSTINSWGIYNCLVTFNWSRAASLIYTGIDRDGLGYRDTAQDLMGVMHAIPEEAGRRLELLITGQYSNGAAQPVILPVTHSPGKETRVDHGKLRSDDSLWLFNAIPLFVKETGDCSFYEKRLPYADEGEDSVLGHMKKAIEFSLKNSGVHGFPCGLSADWNDCLKFGQDGESVFVALQLRLALRVYREAAEFIDQPEEARWALENLQKLDDNLRNHAWDGEWFLRGYRRDGLKFGSKESEEGKIFLNPQSWAVISGLASNKEANSALEAVNRLLATEYGVAICDPPFTTSDWNIVRAQ